MRISKACTAPVICCSLRSRCLSNEPSGLREGERTHQAHSAEAQDLAPVDVGTPAGPPGFSRTLHPHSLLPGSTLQHWELRQGHRESGSRTPAAGCVPEEMYLKVGLNLDNRCVRCSSLLPEVESRADTLQDLRGSY